MAEAFRNVYAVPVMAPTTFLQPGTVIAKAGPVPAILDIGRYPDGVDDTARAISAAFVTAGIVSEVRSDIMRWKWSKMVMNLGNSIEVVCGPAARISPLGRAVDQEGRAVLAAAGIDHVSPAEDKARRADILRWTPDGTTGGSSWQSVTRGQPVETDHITGELVRLAREHGVPTPVNDVLLRRALEVSARGEGAGTTPIEEILAEADQG